MSEPAKLSCRNLWKVYGANPGRYFASQRENAGTVEALLDQINADLSIPACVDVSFDVAPGETFIIMGLSGSGKSTVVRCLSRLIEPTAGQVLLDGEDLIAKSEQELIEIRRHKFGMVFQNFGLLPHLTVLENAAFPLRVQGIGEEERNKRAMEMIELVGLSGRELAYPRQLSGGQQQRVGIARSLAVEPDIWFLDEPFSALDPLIRRQMQDEFIRLRALLHKTIVFITHDFLEALRLADRIAIMKDGRIVQIGTPSEIILDPADDYVAKFTNDVPLMSVLTIADVLEPFDGRLDVLPEVKRTMLIQDVFHLFASHPAGFAVAGGDGRIEGQLTAAGVLAALARHESTAP